MQWAECLPSFKGLLLSCRVFSQLLRLLLRLWPCTNMRFSTRSHRQSWYDLPLAFCIVLAILSLHNASLLDCTCDCSAINCSNNAVTDSQCNCVCSGCLNGGTEDNTTCEYVLIEQILLQLAVALTSSFSSSLAFHLCFQLCYFFSFANEGWAEGGREMLNTNFFFVDVPVLHHLSVRSMELCELKTAAVTVQMSAIMAVIN